MSCGVGKVTEGLENELWRRWSDGKLGEWALLMYTATVLGRGRVALLILQAFRHFTYVIAYYPTLRSLYQRHSSFSNFSVASPTSQLILQPLFRFSYVTCSSLTSPGEPPMIQMQKREWSAESNGKLLHLFIPGKTALKDLPSAELQPRFLDLGRTLRWGDMSGKNSTYCPNFMILVLHFLDLEETEYNISIKLFY